MRFTSAASAPRFFSPTPHLVSIYKIPTANHRADQRQFSPVSPRLLRRSINCDRAPINRRRRARSADAGIAKPRSRRRRRLLRERPRNARKPDPAGSRPDASMILLINITMHLYRSAATGRTRNCGMVSEKPGLTVAHPSHLLLVKDLHEIGFIAVACRRLLRNLELVPLACASKKAASALRRSRF
jgi:hypothetical protein